MKKGLLAGLAIGVLVFGMTGMANATSAFTFTSPVSDYTNGSWVFGEKFTVGSSNITVDALGYYDDRGDGFIASHAVGIFTESGTLLASTTVESTDTLINDFRYHSIVDLTLLAGQQYRIVGVSGSDNYNIAINNHITDSRITDNGSAYYSGTTLGIGNDWTDTRLWAVNFDIKGSSSPVPEPATMLLFGTGIAGLAAVGRRKRS